MSTPGPCFETKTYPIQEFLQLNGVLQDYLQENKKLASLVSTFQNIDQLGENITAKSNFPHREVLTRTLKRQNQNCNLSTLQNQNIEALKDENTFCMTTAHQTNLFGGPLYFLQKAVSVIKACRLAKEKFPDKEFVPMYWLGTEDHDFEELNHLRINGKKITWKDEQGGAFGRYSTETLTSVFNQLSAELGDSKQAEFLRGVFESYTQEKNITDATRFLLNKLLGNYGLLIIDGDDVELKKLLVPIFEKELIEEFSSKACETSIQFLENQYGSSQAHARAINLFYLQQNDRSRIMKEPYGFSVYKQALQFSTKKLLVDLKDNPTKFSPNVVLRPLMQEICLPNLMYVGGGGEISYWFQLKPIFDAVEIPFPMLALRDSAMFVPKKISEKLNQLHVTIDETFKTKDELKKKVVQEQTQKELKLQDQKRAIHDAMSEMEAKARKIDFTLSASAKAEEQRMMNALSNLEKKMMRAEKKNHQIVLQRIDAIYDHLYPNYSLQERTENFSQYYIQYGEAWIEWMLANFNLFDQNVKVMVEVDC